MFRESIGEYKLNMYLNRKQYRILLKAMKKKNKNVHDQRNLNWAQRKTEETNV